MWGKVMTTKKHQFFTLKMQFSALLNNIHNYTNEIFFKPRINMKQCKGFPSIPVLLI